MATVLLGAGSTSAPVASVASVAAARAGARTALGVISGFVPYALVIGSTAATSGIDPWAGWATSWTLFGGTAQLVTIGMLGDGASFAAVALAVALINLRFLVYGAALAPEWRGAPAWWRAVAAYFIVDPTYLVAAAHAEHTDDPVARRGYYLGSAVTMWVVWQLTTLVGLVAGAQLAGLIPARTVMVLVLLALAASMVSTPGRRSAAAAGLGVGAVAVVLPFHSGLVVAGLAGAVAGLMVDSRRSS